VKVQGWVGFGAEDKTKFWFGENTDDEHKQNNSPTRLLIAFRAISTKAVD
jgi:hypothetical protein